MVVVVVVVVVHHRAQPPSKHPQHSCMEVILGYASRWYWHS